MNIIDAQSRAIYLNAISFYRAGRYLKKLRIPLLPRFFEILIFILFNSSIPLTAEIGRGTRCGHRGIAVVIHPKTIIGDNCLIGAQVGIGGRGKGVPGAPVIGNNVIISIGAKILGPVTVGDYAVVGANAVVLENVPPGATVAGIPAKFLESKNSEI